MRVPRFYRAVGGVMAGAVTAASVGAQGPAAWAHFQRQSAAALAALQAQAAPSPSGHPEAVPCPLAFATFFLPVDAAGLEFAPTAHALAGQRVRVSGYMVREGRRGPGAFLLTAQPLSIDPGGSGETAHLPPVTLQVYLAPEAAEQSAGWRPGRLTVEGELEIGVQTDPAGRTSLLRLRLDAAASATVLKGGDA